LSNKRTVYLQDKTQKRSHDALVEHTFEDPHQPFALEPGDVISVRINYYQLTQNGETAMSDDGQAIRSVQHPYLNGFTVDDDLNIQLPVVGPVKVGGLTPGQAEKEIARISEKYYSAPTVKVFLMNFKITVLGEVGRAGTFDVYNNKITVFEALGMANDAGPYANREAVRITRSRGNQNQIYYLDLTDETVLSSPKLYLQPNDVILVKAQKRKKYTLNDSQGVVRALSVLLSVGSIVIAVSKSK
jgi:polysaccharide export outer membrane protein